MKGLIVKVVIHADRVKRRTAAKKRKVLFRQGGYLQRTMRRSMRYSTKKSQKSQPGQPPRAHKKTGAHLRKGVRFNVDLQNDSVICGPDLKPDSKVNSLKPLPQLLNEGGTVDIKEGLKVTKATIAPRPFTAPVFTDGGENFRKLIEQEPL